MKRLIISFILCSFVSISVTSPTFDDFFAQAKKFSDQGNQQEAEKVYQIVLKQEPDNITALFNLGLLYVNTDMPHKAEECFRALHGKGISSASYNLAFVLRRTGKYQEAIDIYEQLRAQDHGINENIPFGLANAYLTLGNFDAGLPIYEEGRKSSSSMANKLMPDSPIQGKTILIIEEWGIGDTFHFIRYAKLLKDRGAAKIIVCARSSLHKILSLCPYIDQLYPLEHQPRTIAFDYQITMISLMHACKTTMQTIPTQIPYLYADRSLVEHWSKKTENDRQFKIGINWKGTLNKNMLPEQFLPLTQIQGVSLYALQKNAHELPDQLRSVFKTYQDFDESHGAFMDTAALIKNMDLVITVDTSIAHLAGGLGVPTWILVPHWADWRWFLNRSDSPWYPTMRIFRQPKPGDWKSVIEEVCKELKEIVKG